MKKLFITLFCSFIFFGISQPSFVWGKKVGGSKSDRSNDSKVDANNNLIVVGDFTNTVDFDPNATVFNLVAATGNRNAFILKLDANGNFLWAKQFAGILTNGACVPLSVALDQSGNILMTGSFYETVDFDPGPGVFTLTTISTTGSPDIFVAKLDPNGNLIWAKQFSGPTNNTNISGQSISCDANGNVYSCGSVDVNPVDFDPGPGTYTLASNGARDVYVSKLDASGNFAWAKTFGGLTADYGLGITLDGNSNVYTTGYFTGLVDFDPGPSTFTLSSIATNADAFVQKMDQNGSFIWAKNWGGNNQVISRNICVKSGTLFTVGDFFGTTDFDPAPSSSTMTSYGWRDVFVNTLDLNGNFIFAKQIGGPGDDIGHDICTNNANSICLAGQFAGTCDFDPGPGTYTLTSVSAGADGFVSVLNSNGDFVVAGKFSGTNIQRTQSIDATSTGHIYATGFFSSSPFDLDPTLNTFNVNTNGSDDVFMVKLSACATSPTITNSVFGPTSICISSPAQIFSLTQSSDATSYSWSLPVGWSGSSTTNTISVTPGSSGSISVTALNACGSSSAAVLSVTVNPTPTISVNSGAICSGNSFTISPSGASTYTIQGGSAVVSPTANASYTVVGTSTAGCVSNTFATSNITVNPLPTIFASTNNSLICVGQMAVLTASGAASYTWNPGGSGASINVSPTITTNYTITGLGANGCSNTFVFTQNVSNCSGLTSNFSTLNTNFSVFPNPFSDKVTISSSEIIRLVKVYNALGELVHCAEINSRKAELDLAEQSAGIFFLRLENSLFKLVKN